MVDWTVSEPTAGSDTPRYDGRGDWDAYSIPTISFLSGLRIFRIQ